MSLDKLLLTKKRKEILERLEIYSINDLLSYYPFRYEENNLMNISMLENAEKICIQAKVLSQPLSFRYGFQKSVTRFKVLHNNVVFECIIYNRAWLKLNIGAEIIITGKLSKRKIQITNLVSGQESTKILGIIPYYRLKEGISQNDIKKIIDKNKELLFNNIEEEIPLKYRQKYQLINRSQALLNIHYPKDLTTLKKSVSYLKYVEFLSFYLCINLRKQHNISVKKAPKHFDYSKVNKLIDSLAFDLTSDQKKALLDILNDLKSENIMYRLLQGDVGCGKTIVALIALYANFLAGYQGLLMAPTEILANQHFEDALNLFNREVNIACLTSSKTILERKKILSALENGQIDILFGTHSLFQETVNYRKLGLIITDEQQRFGVRQRRSLKAKSSEADFLLMSATPIPRTLASALYGDMEISNIKTMPKNRQGCDTYFINQNSIVRIIDQINKTLSLNHQIYVICSSINQKETQSKDVLNITKHLQEYFKNYRIDMLHGQMNNEEKNRIIQDFYTNKIQILVSTTVVEVGVNVKNATMMIIYNAERFGLSQLHQLRGRIQRGHHKGQLYLLSDSKDEDTLKRFDILCQTNCGFELAYEDLKIRGPGDILGIRQSGLPNFILGDIFKDTNIVEAAKKDSLEILENAYELENKHLIDHIASQYLEECID